MSDDPFAARSTETTWGPYPGDATQTPPTPPAPEIPITSRWLWMAGLSVAARLLILAVFVVIVVAVIIAVVS